MSNLVTVGISDMQIVRSADALVTYALGSCVGICLYDPLMKIGALGHIMLPVAAEINFAGSKRKYADTCIPLMISEMEKLGCSRARLVAKIAGGAKMFDVGVSTFGNIGDRNVLAVRDSLRRHKIRINAEDIGLNYGRTVYFYTEDGKMVVKSFASGIKSY
ncbi:MAG: chemotaxis protein CheD [Clostridia bacterium]|nr:chemotaxis protein CheD [Clostridia bacterium]